MKGAQHVLRWVGGEAFVAAPTRPSPALLRFDSDDFMDRLLALLEATPQALPSLVAKPESWQMLQAPTPVVEAVPQRSAPARAMARSRALLGFQRGSQGVQSPPPGTVALAPPAEPLAPAPLKLFQPVHQRFYLAAAHLVCELPGLPTRTTAAGDKSGMLLRRVLTDARTGRPTQCAFVKGPGVPGRWVPLTNADEVPAGEEWLSVFPLAYQAPAGPPRKMLAGLVPVARHDDYRFASLGPAPASAADTRIADLKALARMKVIAPWQGLIERAMQSRTAAAAAPGEKPWTVDSSKLATATKAALQAANDQLQEASWRLLQDFSEFLAASLPQVHAGLASGTATQPDAQKLLDVLAKARWTSAERALPAVGDVFSAHLLPPNRDITSVTDLRAALAAVGPAGQGVSKALDDIESRFPSLPESAWPSFAFALAVATGTGRLQGPFNGWPPKEEDEDVSADVQETAYLHLDELDAALGAAIVEAVNAGTAGRGTAQATHAARLADELKTTLADDAGPPRYILRFVHRRCDCGPLHPLVLSAPSEVFELAGFFDPDAPLRPIRIALPFDTSPGGLRKFGKNSAFIMSDLLCGQMKRVRRLGFGDLVLSVLPWPFHKDLDTGDMGPCGGGGANSFGVICSLSIPIITIVAFILLIVIATLLDLIFRWLPFLMVCFPVPGLKGKKP